MLLDYLTAVVFMIALSGLWLAVQRAWRRHFPGPDTDALAHRGGCHGCNCGPDQCRQTNQKSTTTEATDNAPARL